MKQFAQFAISLLTLASLSACGVVEETASDLAADAVGVEVVVAGTSPLPPTEPTSPPTAGPAAFLDTQQKSVQFLTMAGLGGPLSDAQALVGTDAALWTQSQMAMPPTGYEAQISLAIPRADAKNRDNAQLLWQTMFNTDAQLRTRMTYALSQITVVGDRSFFNDGYGMAAWYDTLDHNAFGNYRDLLEDVTYSPMMGRYLTFLFNKKGNASTGQQPDENYAREVMQLFTIGLVELNMDGTPKLQPDRQPFETYDNDDVVGLARVFTGFVLQGTSHRNADRAINSNEVPMVLYEPDHSTLEKSFLGTTIPENTPAAQSVDMALDTLFAHPNLAPFISRQLIQRFTASSPSPDYVERVAMAFETGSFTSDTGVSFGTAQRGDLAATIAAILLDKSLYDGNQLPSEGKVREPVLKFAQFARTYAKAGTTNVMTGEFNQFRDTSDPNDRLGQAPLKSPSVFNFYRPGYIAPNTETGKMDLTAPELQIVNQASNIGYLDFIFRYLTRIEGGNHNGLIVPDLTEELTVSLDPAALRDLIDLKLTGGRMSPTTRANMLAMLEAYEIRPDRVQEDANVRVILAVMMAVSSPAFATL